MFFMSNEGMLIIFSGPSGVGKGTICKKLFEKTNLNLVYSISMTTRAKRVNEIEGKDYFFVTEQQFLQAVNDNLLLEHAQFVGNYYGTPLKYCEQMTKLGKNVILEVEVQGALQILEKVSSALSIFLIPPSLQELEQRIRLRQTESEAVILHRLEKARQELLLQNQYDYVVVNRTVEQACEDIAEIIRNEMQQKRNYN